MSVAEVERDGEPTAGKTGFGVMRTHENLMCALSAFVAAAREGGKRRVSFKNARGFKVGRVFLCSLKH